MKSDPERHQALQRLAPRHAPDNGNLANTLSELGDHAGACEFQEQVLEAFTLTLGPEHPDTLGAEYNLAISLRRQGDYAGASELFEQALETRARILGPVHPDTLQAKDLLEEVLAEAPG